MRNFFKKICKFFFVVSFILLVVSITLRNTVISTISVGFTKRDISERIVEVIAENFSELDSYTLSRIEDRVMNSSEVDDIATIYFDALLNDIKNDTVSDVDITDEVNALINNNVSDIPPVFQQLIRDKVNSIDFDNLYKKLLDYVKTETTTEVKQAINIFGILTSKLMRNVLMLILALSFSLIIMLNKVKREALYDFGIAFLIAGGIMIVILFVLRNVLGYIIALTSGSNTGNSLTLLTICGFGSLVLGMILIDLYERDDEDKVNAKKSYFKLLKRKLRK